ncbi:hypothetical protein ABZP36_029800 [Zizania latifolia]
MPRRELFGATEGGAQKGNSSHGPFSASSQGGRALPDQPLNIFKTVLPFAISLSGPAIVRLPHPWIAKRLSVVSDRVSPKSFRYGRHGAPRVRGIGCSATDGEPGKAMAGRDRLRAPNGARGRRQMRLLRLDEALPA